VKKPAVKRIDTPLEAAKEKKKAVYRQNIAVD